MTNARPFSPSAQLVQRKPIHVLKLPMEDQGKIGHRLFYTIW